MIVGFSGKARAGKDTCADYLVSKYGFRKVSLADPLKQIAIKYFGLTHDEVYVTKEPHVRRILQGLGMAMRGEINENVWINKLMRSFNSEENVVVPDIRMSNEVDMLIRCKGAVVRIERDVSIGGDEKDHATEKELDDYLFPQYVHNDGTIDDLYKKIDGVMFNLGFGVVK